VGARAKKCKKAKTAVHQFRKLLDRMLTTDINNVGETHNMSIFGIKGDVMHMQEFCEFYHESAIICSIVQGPVPALRYYYQIGGMVVGKLEYMYICSDVGMVQKRDDHFGHCSSVMGATEMIEGD
jgi:hypothetical protein